MRFGQTLDEGIVPEWKGQYLNYKEGKRLIKRLATDKVQLADRLRGIRTPGSAAAPQSSAGANARPSYPDFELPSPALEITEQDLARASSEGVSPTNTGSHPDELTERSPLFSEPTQTYHSSASTETLESSASPGMIPLRPLDKGKVNEFSSWLNAEINKVDKFYSNQEDETIRKLQVLTWQLRTLKDHQVHNKRLKENSLHVPKGAVKFFDRLELPQWPLSFRGDGTHNSNDGCTSGAHVPMPRRSRDFERHPYTYLQAKHMIKMALYEYYHFVQQLKGYRALNETAVRKITKKFDKTFSTHLMDTVVTKQQKRFLTSHKLDEITKQVEQLFADYYRDSNHKNAVQTLQANRVARSHNFEVLLIGLFVGGGLPLFIRAIVKAVQLLNTPDEREVRYLLQIWAGFFFISLMMLLFSINILVWHFYRVNYQFIFELVRLNTIDYRQFAVLPSALFFFLSLLGWLTFDVPESALPGRYFPCIFLGVMMVAFVAPVPIYWPARRWLLVGLIRLFLSGLYSVEFRDFFLGDIFCSLTYTTANIEFFFCLYSTKNWWLSTSDVDRCSSGRSHLLGFFQCLPGIWRFLQCIRRYGDSLDWFPHLLNAGKYSMLILYYMFLSLARINHESKKYQVLALTFAGINSIYSSLWDVFMDFSLGPNLRPVLVYPRWTYYAVMVVDPFMRLQWILYAVYWDQVEQSAKISFIVALIEVFRRFLWIFFRVENEHAANIMMYRASKDLDLPYATKAPDQTLTPRQQPGRTPRADPETPVSTATSQDPAPSSRRRLSLASPAWPTPDMDHVRWVLNRAHTADFSRRRPVSEEGPDDEGMDED